MNHSPFARSFRGRRNVPVFAESQRGSASPLIAHVPPFLPADYCSVLSMPSSSNSAEETRLELAMRIWTLRCARFRKKGSRKRVDEPCVRWHTAEEDTWGRRPRCRPAYNPPLAHHIGRAAHARNVRPPLNTDLQEVAAGHAKGGLREGAAKGKAGSADKREEERHPREVRGKGRKKRGGGSTVPHPRFFPGILYRIGVPVPGREIPERPPARPSRRKAWREAGKPALKSLDGFLEPWGFRVVCTALAKS